MKNLLLSSLFLLFLFPLNMTAQTIYDYEFNTLDGEKFSMESLKGSPFILVNTASNCGMTPQYEDLQHIYETYREKGLQIIGFPCNDFGGQEPGLHEDIKTFCQKNYGVSFPMMEKISIKGENAFPLYAHLTSQTDTEVAWNFQKYLVDSEGNIVKVIEPMSRLVEDENITAIENILTEDAE